MSLSERIKAHAVFLGFNLVGITPATPPRHGQAYTAWVNDGFAGEMAYMNRNMEKRLDPGQLLPGARSIIAVAMNYYNPDSDAGEEKDDPSGVIARYARGMDYHDVMKEKLERLLAFIQSESNQPVSGKVYVDTGPVLERDYATDAGLGWYGKHTNLINKRLGSWLLIGEILIDLELNYDHPATDHCGVCRRCIDACPTDAITEPYRVDSRKCIAYLTIELKGSIPEEYRPAIGARIFGCDDCQDVCPWNRRAPVASEPSFSPRPFSDTPSLVDLLNITGEEFRVRYRGTPIARARRRGLLRNAAVALGNSGDGAAEAALIRALEDEETLVRAHAAWALGRMGADAAEQALMTRYALEDDPETRREILRGLDEIRKRSRTDPDKRERTNGRTCSI